MMSDERKQDTDVETGAEVPDPYRPVDATVPVDQQEPLDEGVHGIHGLNPTKPDDDAEAHDQAQPADQG